MKIGYLGAGTWGTALASLLANNSHSVIVWDRDPKKIQHLRKFRQNPKLKNFNIPDGILYTENILDAIQDVDMIVESVTSQGIREVFYRVCFLFRVSNL